MTINPFDIIKNSPKIQAQMEGFNDKLSSLIATGSSGGGMVEIDLNGRLEVTEVRISPETLEDKDVRMLEDLVMTAFSDSREKIREIVNRELSVITGGLNISRMPGFPG